MNLRKTLYAVAALSLLCTFSTVFAAETDNALAADSVYIKTDVPPAPVGGMKAVYNNLEYPKIAVLSGIKGTVLTSLIIDQQGNVIGTEIMKSAHPMLDSAALRVLRATKFTPGMKDNKAVTTKVVIPIRFAFDGDAEEGGQPQLTPVGGMQAILSKVVYPDAAVKNGTQGRVLLRISVSKKGDVTGIKVMEGLKDGCTEAAKKAVKSTKFNPALKDGKPIDSEVVLPIDFKLR